MDSLIAAMTDAEVNTSLDVPGANSVYAIAHHCIEMSRWWLGTFGCGLDLPRDRAGEFSSRGTVSEVRPRLAQARTDTPRWTGEMMRHGIIGRDARGTTAKVDLALVSPEWVVLHVVHELAQHLGQMQITGDLVTASTRI